MLRRLAPRLIPLILVLSVVAGACSSPPQKEREQAESAILSAQAADAGAYAMPELQVALGWLKEYDAAVAKGDYRLALSHAINSRDKAYEAAKLATERKRAAKSDADRAIVELNGLVMMAKSRLAGTPPPLTPAANERLRKALTRTPGLLQEAGSRLQKQDFKGVVGLVQPMSQEIKKVLTPQAGRKGK